MPSAHTDQHHDLQAFAADLARRAGRHALQWFRQPLEVEAKGDDSPVTIADRAVETMLRQAIVTRFPDHGILGEEFGGNGAVARHTWVIDPIDGTRSFITGWPIWGTLIALLDGGQPTLGVIEMPALKEQWLGVAGRKTTFTDSTGTLYPCQTSACTSLRDARFYTTSPMYFSEQDRALMERIAATAQTTRFGGDCYSYGLLASGHVDLVVEALLQPYDYLAIVPVVTGAGGVITDWEGRVPDLYCDGRIVAAATPALHSQALDMLHS
jgi:inositol-phosphate phosphatase / L-galactose 1-phosphate phosphatase / histidinol-phosphatase